MNIEFDLLSYTLLTTILGTLTWKSMNRPRSADMHPLLLNAQSDVAKLRHPGESAIYRSRMNPIGSPLCYTFDRTTQTLADFYRLGGIEKHGPATMIHESTNNVKKQYTYKFFSRKLSSVYKGLRSFGNLVPRSEDENCFVGIYGRNSLSTTLASIACHCNGLVTIPISAKASTSHVIHTIKKSRLRLLVIDSGLVDEVIGFLKGTSLKHIVCIGEDSLSNKSKERIESLGFEVITFDGLERLGCCDPYEPIIVAPNDMASIYFQNESKLGVVLTQKNILSSIWSYSLALPPGKRLSVKDCLMLDLPIDDLFGYVLLAVMTRAGGSIAFADVLYNSDCSGITKVFALAEQIKPTVFLSSPVFYREVKQYICTQYVNSFLFERGYKVKREYINQGLLVSDCKYDLLLFKRIRQYLFGGHLRLIYINNDDAADPILAEFLRIVLSAQVLQTFNTTETASAMTASVFYDYYPDSNFKGAPLPCNEIKVVDVPELHFLSSDTPNPRGELWVRGNNVFSKYYMDEDATDEVLDIDGWFMTGLMCEILPNGTLKSLGKRSCH